MKKTMWLAIIRHFLTFMGGVFVVRGMIDETIWTELSGAAMTLVGGIWSIIDKKTVSDDN